MLASLDLVLLAIFVLCSVQLLRSGKKTTTLFCPDPGPSQAAEKVALGGKDVPQGPKVFSIVYGTTQVVP